MFITAIDVDGFASDAAAGVGGEGDPGRAHFVHSPRDSLTLAT